MYLRLDGEERKPEVFLATTFMERGPALSSDGKWLAYASNESGEMEVYVRPFLRPGAKVKVSAERGWTSRWSPDGKEIFYRNEEKIMGASVSVQEDTLRAQNPRLLFELKGDYNGPNDVAPDGSGLLFYRPAGETKEQSQQPTVVVNWFEELKAKVQTKRE
jgi:Tol biopolymer transport system component